MQTGMTEGTMVIMHITGLIVITITGLIVITVATRDIMLLLQGHM